MQQQLSELIDTLKESEVTDEIIEIVQLHGEGKTFAAIA
jgi:flagellar biosynthesis regulator FlbT